MIRLLFEDNKSSPISRLLLSSMHGKYIHFSEGNEFLLREYINLSKKYPTDYFIIFVDTPPNRQDLYNTYIALCDSINQDKCSVIPIICIEYIYLRMLEERNIRVPYGKMQNLYDNLVRKFDYENVRSVIESDTYLNDSLEHIYKAILNDCAMRCFKNSNEGINGLFCREDCKCERKYCRVNCNLKLWEKAEYLYTNLPIFPEAVDYEITHNQLGIQAVSTSVNEVLNDCAQLYNSICDRMKIPRIYIYS